MKICKYCHTKIPSDRLCPNCTSPLDGYYEQVAEDHGWDEQNQASSISNTNNPNQKKEPSADD